MKRKIAFFIDTTQPVSNRQTLFLELAGYWAKHTDDSVYYINNYFECDEMRFRDTRLKYCDLATFDFAELEGATFFTPVNHLMHLICHIQNLQEAKICLYAYDAHALDWLVHNLGAPVKAQASLTEFLTDLKACSYLNYSCVLKKDEFYKYNEEIFLPLALHEELPEDYRALDLVNPEKISIGYVGNINAKTINSINNLINNLGMMGIDKNIDLHLIGNTYTIPSLKYKMCSEKRTRLIFTGFLGAQDKKDYIRENVDFVLATDENALEVSLYGVPVVIPVMNDNPFSGNNYVYLYDTFGYYFKWNISEFLTYDNVYNRLTVILDDIYKNGRKKAIAQKCFEFSSENCSLEHIAKALTALMEQSELTLKECLSNEYIYDTLQKYNEYFLENNGTFNDFLRDRNKK